MPLSPSVLKTLDAQYDRVPIIDHSLEGGKPLPPKLLQKLLKIVGSLSWIEKKGSNSAQGYKYVQADDMAAEVRQKLVEQGVMSIASVESASTREFASAAGKPIRLTTVDVRWTFSDVDTGESISVNVPGEAMDSGDKAIYKAMTGSLKYCLKMTFLIPTGDDPEEDSASDEVYREPAPAPVVRVPRREGRSSTASEPTAASPTTVVPFGKHKGKTFNEVPTGDLQWLTDRFEEKVNARDPKWHASNVKILEAARQVLLGRGADGDVGTDQSNGQDGEEIPF